MSPAETLGGSDGTAGADAAGDAADRTGVAWPVIGLGIGGWNTTGAGASGARLVHEIKLAAAPATRSSDTPLKPCCA